jgi:hypothetical protein
MVGGDAPLPTMATLAGDVPGGGTTTTIKGAAVCMGGVCVVGADEFSTRETTTCDGLIGKK